jgi:hypothetical protein
MAQISELEATKMIGGQEIEAGTVDVVKTALTLIPPSKKLLAGKDWANVKARLAKACERSLSVTVKTAGDRETAKLYGRLLKPVVTGVNKRRLELTRTIKERLIDPINAEMNPVIKAADSAVDHLNNQIRQFDQKAIEKQREEQRKADAEADRRRKLQDAAVARGGTPRKEIVAEEISKPPAVQTDSSTYFRMGYEIVDEAAVPKSVKFNGQVVQVCRPDPGALSSIGTAMEANFERKEKGYANIEQPIPGVRFFWKQHFRRG